MEKVFIRVVAGELRGRRLTAFVHTGMRPTPQMVREALFSILGDAVPDRPFFDVFAGTGIVGIESLSRGASKAVFVERDFKLMNEIEKYLDEFGVGDRAQLLRTDCYRWGERWVAPSEPVNVFFSPPFPDLVDKPEAFSGLVTAVLTKAAVGSVLVVQGEDGFDEATLPEPDQWELRKYGRNLLLIYVKAAAATADTSASS